MEHIFIFPTEHEAAPFRRHAPDATIYISGVGMAAVAATLVRAASDSMAGCGLSSKDAMSDLLFILAGVAGSYGDVPTLCEVVEVESECCVELPERFRRTYRATECVTALRRVASNTLHGMCADPASAEIENMEGAAFFAVAEALAVRGVELRAISNRVGDEFKAWRIDEAAEVLANELIKIIK